MGYGERYETSPLCPCAHRRGAHRRENRSALVGWRAGAPLPDGVGQRPWRAGAADRCAGGLRRENGRQLIHRFNRAVVRCNRALPAGGSSRPHQPPPRAFAGERAEPLRALLHRRPRDFGHPTSLWTLDLAAEVSFAQGLTPRLVTGEAIREDPRSAAAGHRLDSAPSTGSPAPIRRTPEKKAPRPPDRAGRGASRLGAGLRRRGLVESAGPAPAAQPGRSQPLRLVEQTVAKDRSRPQSAWPAMACCCAAPARRKRSGCASSPAGPSVRSPSSSWTGAAPSWQRWAAAVGADLGQRLLACQ